MRKLRAPRRTLRLPLLGIALFLFTAALASLAVASTRGDAVGTLEVRGALNAKFDSVDCPGGTPASTSCYHETNVRDTIPGLGDVTVDFTLMQDNFGSACGLVHARIPVVVTGKGSLDLVTGSSVCIDPKNPATFPPIDVTIAGGSGQYAGASGSGVMRYVNREAGPGAGTSAITWTGTLNVAGRIFDTTAPRISGAGPKSVKARRAAGARVRYSVSAADATDGRLPARCLPGSGSLFRVGRTTVNCTAVDGSGNTARARFNVTVKRVHR
jgi:HYR domain